MQLLFCKSISLSTQFKSVSQEQMWNVYFFQELIFLLESSARWKRENEDSDDDETQVCGGNYGQE